MSARGRQSVVRVGWSAFALTAAALGVWAAGFRYNETASLPVGVWRLHAVDRISAGVIVNFCPPANAALQEAKQRGYLSAGPCVGDLEPMFKPIVAVPGDHVDVGPAGVVVNGHAIPHTAVIARDGVGRALPSPQTGRVPPGMVWVVSSFSPLSFDSRYFGPIAINSIAGIATPVWVRSNP